MGPGRPDMVSKSANYCFASRTNPTVGGGGARPLEPPPPCERRPLTSVRARRRRLPRAPQGLLLLCEVALGEMNELTQADHAADKLPAGKHSTKGLGRTFPNPDEFETLADGVVVPMGKAVTRADSHGRPLALQYNEYIVYKVEQLRIRYLIQVTFDFK